MAKWLDKYQDGGNFNGWGYDTTGRNYSPAWGGQFQYGGFLQPNDWRLPSGIAIPNKADILSSELATSIGGEDGEPAYLVPSFKGGKRVNAAKEFIKTGEHLGGPFKTWQEADKFDELRHEYVEKGQSLPSPLKWWGEMQMGGSMPGAVGFTYARTAGSAPANGKYAKKTKASAQNGKVVDPTGDDRSTLGFKTNDPAFQYVKSNAFVPFNESNFEGMKQNIAGYMNSPLYMQRLSNSISDSEQAKDVQKQRLDNLLNTKINNKYSGNLGTHYDPIKGYVNVDSGEFANNSIIAHELGHAIAPNYTTTYGQNPGILSKVRNIGISALQPFEELSGEELKKLNIPLTGKVANVPYLPYRLAMEEEHYKPQKGKFSAKTAASETYGDLTGVRQSLLDNGITTEFGQDLTPEIFEKALKNPKISNDPTLQRMRLKFKDEDIIKMNNEVAQLDNKAPLTQAQNGKEMQYYQDGLDFKPKSISKNGKVIKDDRGQWAHPGEITEISSPDITMQGVDYPVLGISDTGHTQMMYPDQDYKFDGKKVTEFPIMQKGGWLDKYQAQTGISMNIGSGTYQPTSKVATKQDIKEQVENAESARIQAMRDKQGYIKKAGPKQSTASKVWNIATHPMTALSYKTHGKDIPEHFERGEQNILDNAVNIINPFGLVDAAASIPGNINRGEYLQAALNTASVLPMLSELRGASYKNIYKYNPYAETLAGKTRRQIFGDDAYKAFLEYGPTTQPKLSQAEQLAQWNAIKGEAEGVLHSGTGDVMNIAGTTKINSQGMKIGVDYPFAYFSEGSSWYGPKRAASMAEALGQERIIVPKPGADLKFYPAGESSVIFNPKELSQRSISSYAGRRRVLSPEGAANLPEAFDVYEGNPHWLKGYKKISKKKNGGWLNKYK